MTSLVKPHASFMFSPRSVMSSFGLPNPVQSCSFFVLLSLESCLLCVVLDLITDIISTQPDHRGRLCWMSMVFFLGTVLIVCSVVFPAILHSQLISAAVSLLSSCLAFFSVQNKELHCVIWHILVLVFFVLLCLIHNPFSFPNSCKSLSIMSVSLLLCVGPL